MVLTSSSFRALWKSSAFSSSSANCDNSSAMMVFMIVLVQEIESAEPSIRNSNLLPVKAKGDVLFLSVVSFLKFGSASTPISNSAVLETYFLPFSRASITSSSSEPTKTETIAGGASFAPRRWSFPADAAESLSRGADFCRHWRTLTSCYACRSR